MATDYSTVGSIRRSGQTGSLTVDADNIVTVDGKSWKNENGALPFYPETGEFVVLRSDHYELENVKCP